MTSPTAQASLRSCGLASHQFPVNDQAITVRNSGEYGDRKFKKKLDDGTLADVAIYSARAGSVWRVRQQDWFRKIAERVIVTTTERLPSLLAIEPRPSR